MNLAALFTLLSAAREACGHREYVIIGSLSILGMEQVSAIPGGMTMSIDADCYTRADPGRIYDLKDALGEGSAFHRSHGYFLDPVSPKLPTLPDGWEQRLVRVSRDDVTAWFLEPNDAAVSKLARGEARDIRWVKAGSDSGLVSLPLVQLRMTQTSFLDDEEKALAKQRVEQLSPRRSRKQI